MMIVAGLLSLVLGASSLGIGLYSLLTRFMARGHSISFIILSGVGFGGAVFWFDGGDVRLFSNVLVAAGEVLVCFACFLWPYSYRQHWRKSEKNAGADTGLRTGQQ